MKHHHIIIYSLLALVLVAGMTSCRHGRDDAMLGRLDYVSRCNRSVTVFTERWLPTVDSLVSYFDRHGSANQRMMAHYVRGRVLHDMGEAPAALECYQTAADQADTTRSDCDLYTLTAIYGQMANLFHAQYLPDDEMQALKDAERIAWKDHDTLSAIKAFELRLRPYLLKSDTTHVMNVLKMSYNQYMKYGKVRQAASLLPVAIHISLDRQEYDSAYHYIQKFENLSQLPECERTPIRNGVFYYNKGRYALYNNQNDSALFFFRKALGTDYNEAAYKGLLSVYKKKHIADSIAQYAILFARANDSCYYHVNQEKIRQISAMYDYSRQQHLADESRAKAARLRYFLVLVLLSVLAGAAITAFIYHKVRTQNLLRITQLLRAKFDLQSLLEEKQAQLDNVVSENSSVIEQVTQERNQILIEHIREKKALEQQIEDMERQLSHFSRANHEKAFLSTTIGLRFQTIRYRIPKETPPTNLDWEQCIITFRDYFPSYYSFITNGHALTDDQLRVTIMVRLNYRESEMAFFINTDKQRINRIKLQVNSKIFGIQNSSSLRKNLKEHF